MSSYEELTNEQLLALPTHRLYTVYKLYRKSDALIFGRSDEYYDDDRALADRHQAVRDKCEFIKAELDERGHIPRIHENKNSKSTKHLSGECRRFQRMKAVREQDAYAYWGYKLNTTKPAR